MKSKHSAMFKLKVGCPLNSGNLDKIEFALMHLTFTVRYGTLLCNLFTKDLFCFHTTSYLSRLRIFDVYSCYLAK